MNTGLLVSLMLVCGIILGCTPFVCFIGSTLLFGSQGITTNLLLMTFLLTIVMTFGITSAIFSYLQYNSCKKVHNLKQIFANAGIAAAIQFLTLLVVYITGITSIPKSMLPLWLSTQVEAREGIGYGYFTFFASMYGTVIGGTLSAIC
jgi:hypothetical protein